MADYATIQLTKGKMALVDPEDVEKLSSHKWHLDSNGYAARSSYILGSGHKGKFNSLKMHRLITDAPQGMQVDHINGNKLDNRRANLRICTLAQNTYNRPVRGDNKSGYKGVYWKPSHNKYSAEIRVKGKLITLGRFTDPLDAARAYNAKAIESFGEFANLNRIGGV